MDIARIVLEYVQALAWPVVSLTLVLLFRRELASLVATIQRARLPGGVQLDWKRELEAAEAVAQRIEESTEVRGAPQLTGVLGPLVQKAGNLGLQTSLSGYDFSYYFQLAETDPNLALAGLRMELERMLQNLANVHEVSFDPYSTSANALARKLSQLGILPREQEHLLRRVVSLANAALHGRDVSREDSLRAIDAAEPLRRFYLNWLAKLTERQIQK